MEHREVSPIVQSTPLDLLITGWLHAKQQRSQSEKTVKAYADTLRQFRAALHFKGLDLDFLDTAPQACYDNLSERQMVTFVAQQFAAWSIVPGKRVTATTHNQRLSVLSSFYEYAMRNDFLDFNPIKNVERAKVQQYKTAKALSREQTAQGLAEIDRSTRRGKRDYALLSVLLATGRRLSEVADLTLGDVQISTRGIITLHFGHLKGGKEISDRLDGATSKALLTWLHDYYGAQLFSLPKTSPLWVSLAEGGRRGKSYGLPLSIRSISDICKKHLGTGKVHRTRHTWTKNMLDAGAGLPLIQQKLGHNSLATTGIYTEALKSVDNPFAEEIARLAGIE
jgi:site-specific recombinase XerD